MLASVSVHTMDFRIRQRLEFVFDDPIPRGNYLIAIYTRSGKDLTPRQSASAARQRQYNFKARLANEKGCYV